MLNNRPAEAVAANHMPVRWDLTLRPSNFGGANAIYFTGALHELGRHEEELAEARRRVQIYPGLYNPRAHEARALVALGRLDELERLVTNMLTLGPQAYSNNYMASGSPGYVMLAAAEELRIHGHRDASLQLAARAVDWYRGRSGDEAKRWEIRAGLVEALYRAERWQEASEAARAHERDQPDTNPNEHGVKYRARGWVGALAARLGARDDARRIAEELLRDHTIGSCGEPTVRAARIYALLGERERAVKLLQEAVALGYGGAEWPDPYGYGLLFSHAMDLESLHGYPPFEELIKPKG